MSRAYKRIADALMILSFPCRILGMMSGSSLDGLDLVSVLFKTSDGTDFELEAAESRPYPAPWQKRLSEAPSLSGLELSFLDVEYGRYVGEQIKDFITRHGLNVQAVAIHGHTVFHEPRKGLTLQIGSGAAVAAACGLPVVSKFRDKDVALGGEGAPLVPIGDKLLFGQYACCLNLGGIANISYEENGHRVAFDITSCNMVLNALAARLGQAFDRDGALAAGGRSIEALRKELDGLEFYKQIPPKSLGREWYEHYQKPLCDRYLEKGNHESDLLRTFVEHIAFQIGQTVRQQTGRMLITGGGALNLFLTDCIKKACPTLKCEAENRALIEYKEALIFAFLGLLRLQNKANCLSSVTGAAADHIGGCVFL